MNKRENENLYSPQSCYLFNCQSQFPITQKKRVIIDANLRSIRRFMILLFVFSGFVDITWNRKKKRVMIRWSRERKVHMS
jgi:hypothetical protein